MTSVINRKNEHEKVSFDKILNRISTLCYGLDTNYVDPVEITRETINNMYKDITTKELDNLSADICASKIQLNPDFNILATRICISNLHKETSSDYLQVCKSLYDASIVSEKFYHFVCDNNQFLQEVLNYERDYLFDFFGIKTLERSYLLRINNKIIERPQHLWMRVAIQVHAMHDWKEIKEEVLHNVKNTYNLLSQKYFTHATPTLFNSGMNTPQLSSCFLFNMEDNIENIFKTIGDMGKISKYSGGIGVTLSKIRGKNSVIRGTNGKSDGIIPLCKVLEATARYINQGSKRLGSIACYVEPWHVDIIDFIELRKNTGDENLRARDLFLALWIPDVFMEKVMNNEEWYLMCPDECRELNKLYGEEFKEKYLSYVSEGKYKKKIQAQELWNHILECQIETGMPYMLFKDHINRKSNQKNIGMIKSSNLCVEGKTMILIKNKGWDFICNNEDKYVEVWNGEKWSMSLVKKTSEDAKLIEMLFSDGSILRCTKEHVMILENGKRVKAEELSENDVLIPIKVMPDFGYPKSIKNSQVNNSFYTSGFCNGRSSRVYCISKKVKDELFEDKNYFINVLATESNFIISNMDYSSIYPGTENYISFCLKRNNNDKFYTNSVPLNETFENKISWLTGFSDSCGYLDGGKLIFKGEDYDILYKVKLLCQTIGFNPIFNDFERDKAFSDFKTFKLSFTTRETEKMEDLLQTVVRRSDPYNPITYEEKVKEIKFDIKLISKREIEGKYPTWCLHEPENNSVLFNGIVTGNCAEILEYTDENETAVCNLASINLQSFIEEGKDKNQFYNFDKLREVVYTATCNLDKIIDTNFYPTKETEFSNKRHRPIGLGVQGLADVYCRFDMPYSSDEARDLNKRIFENIYYASVRASCDRAKVYGHYSSFKGSPFSEGILQWHLWGVDRKDLSKNLDWDGLIEDVKKYGTRNSLLTALMPTASTSQILKNNESFEPFTSNMYLRKTLAGEYVVVNEHLTRKLISMGLWNKEMYQQILYYNGSVQKIKEIPKEVREIYKTAFEIKQSAIVNQCIDRGCFIDQTQSMNLFQNSPNFDNLSKSHLYSWKRGLKTGMYYLRTQPVVDPIKFGLEPHTIKKIEDKNRQSDDEDENKVDKEDKEDKLYCKKIQRYIEGGNIESCVICSS